VSEPSFFQKTLNRVLGVVPLKKHGWRQEHKGAKSGKTIVTQVGNRKSKPDLSDKKKRFLTKEQAAQHTRRGMNSVYGARAVARELRAEEELIVGNLPAAGASDLSQKGGFSDYPLDKGGNRIPGMPAQTYTTPATHWQRPLGRDERLAQEYDERQAAGEDLPDWEEWFQSQEP
jgi:hypothetical protein